MRYLILSFRNAGFYEPEGNNKVNQYVSITTNQVSNMLHALFGEIPVPSYRPSTLKRVDWIDDLANDTLINIETPMVYQDKSIKSIYAGKYFYPIETQRLHKAAWNSYRDKGSSFVDWHILEVFLGESLLAEYIKVFSAEFGVDVRKEYPAVTAVSKTIEYLSETPLVKFLRYIDSTEKTNLQEIIGGLDDSTPVNVFLKNLLIKRRMPFLRWLLGYATDIAVTKGRNLKITVTNSVGITFTLRRISGKMIIPMPDYAIEKLRNGKGCATLLDDGYVHLDAFVDGDELPMSLVENFININNLPEYEQNFSPIQS